ncbi:AzlD domain-containing protein [Rhodoligotrophos defluvii]|uniref:AzlD domain-containing protein n=1 Tax=Rhodoligotrophos defluvii TaxID=2561934 RepID=UPI0010C96F0C|nr:AzlD domain-containing protein [Rhodoligotrophos defluvii]
MTVHSVPDWLLVLLIGGMSTYCWRLAGVVLVRRLDPHGSALMLVRAIATGLVAALVTKLMIQPPGVLATTDIANRFIALGIGLALMVTLRRHQPLAIVAALLTLVCLEAIGLRLT